MNENTTDASKEAINKAKEAAEAVENSRAEQMSTFISKADDRTVKNLSQALSDVFGENSSAGRFIDVKRIPLICAQITQIHTDISGIQDNLKWAVRVVIGAVILGLLTLLFKS